MRRRTLKDATLTDMEQAVYNLGPLRHDYAREPADFVLELAQRLREASTEKGDTTKPTEK